MDKIDFSTNGGFPLMNDDLIFLDQEYRNVISNLAKGLTSQNVLLSGGNIGINGSVKEIQAAWFLIDGEISYLPYTGSLSTSNDYRVVPDIFVDSSKTRVMKDGSTVTPYVLRRLKVELEDVSNTSYPKLGEFVDLAEAVTRSGDSAWNQAQLNTGWTGTFKYKRVGSVLFIDAEVSCASIINFSTATICTLPSGFLPDCITNTFKIFICTENGGNTYRVSVDYTGNVFVDYFNVSSSTNLRLDAITYPIKPT